ncbi:MAG TPA: trehalase family glycosidase [Acidisarcina sp.]
MTLQQRPLLRAGVLIGVAIICLGPGTATACAQSTSPAAANPGTPLPILQYIHQGWNSLTRSMADCKSVVDIKVTTPPLLYLPAGMATPPAVQSIQRQCGVRVEHLPRHIGSMGDVKVSELREQGLLYLPDRYVVPGGRFNEMYGWDSYFILLGLVADHRVELARGIVENFFFEIDNYGAVLNANRTYFFTRSQPPLLSSMIREVYEHSSNRQQAKVWLAKAYVHAQRDYRLWSTPPHLAGHTGLARYTDIGDGPVPEMEDDSTYYSDVIRWLLAHPQLHTTYLLNSSEQPGQDEAASLARSSCDITMSKVCARAVVDGHRLTSAFYHGDRAMRESGFDTTFRFGPFSGSTDQFAPVCLNSLLYRYERNMAHFASILGRSKDILLWNQRAESRKAAISRYLWNRDKESFYDYNYVSGKQSGYDYLTAFYPLWAGVAGVAQAKSIEKHLPLFEHEGGLAMSGYQSGTQWDLPYGWAPVNWLTVEGLANYGYKGDAQRLSAKFVHEVEQNYGRDGTVREKYNVVSGSANFEVSAGYKANVVGFGWTNGVYLRMLELLGGSRTKMGDPTDSHAAPAPHSSKPQTP